jgi:hypothetical protein
MVKMGLGMLRQEDHEFKASLIGYEVAVNFMGCEHRRAPDSG